MSPLHDDYPQICRAPIVSQLTARPAPHRGRQAENLIRRGSEKYKLVNTDELVKSPFPLRQREGLPVRCTQTGMKGTDANYVIFLLLLPSSRPLPSRERGFGDFLRNRQLTLSPKRKATIKSRLSQFISRSYSYLGIAWATLWQSPHFLKPLSKVAL